MLAHLKSYFFTHAKKNHKNFKGNQYISLDFSNYDLPIQCLISNIALRDWVLVVSIIGRLNFYKRKFRIPGNNLSSCSTIISELIKLPKLVSRSILSLKDFATWWMGEEEIAATALDMLIIHSPHICWKRIKAFCRILTNKVRISWTCFFLQQRESFLDFFCCPSLKKISLSMICQQRKAISIDYIITWWVFFWPNNNSVSQYELSTALNGSRGWESISVLHLVKCIWKLANMPQIFQQIRWNRKELTFLKDLV